jgi:predicted short-subunit dehydrogenase-like oxidoreductase (DUF2520 family)
MDGPTIGFIGAGAVGKGLALAIASRGYSVVAVYSRSRTSAEALAARVPGCESLPVPQEVADRCSLVFITTPDEAINRVASQVKWRTGQGVVHCSGAESLDVLEPAARQGALPGSFHPFQTFACLETPEEAVERLEGTLFSIEGHGWLRSFLEKIAAHLGGRSIPVRPEDRAIYHASAVMACGYVVALLEAAAGLWQAMGASREDALSTIVPLARTTLENISRAGPEASATGPLMRGDAATLQRHLEALESRLPRLIPLYSSLSLESLSLAREKVGRDKLEEMERLIEEYARRHV